MQVGSGGGRRLLLSSVVPNEISSEDFHDFKGPFAHILFLISELSRANPPQATDWLGRARDSRMRGVGPAGSTEVLFKVHSLPESYCFSL